MLRIKKFISLFLILAVIATCALAGSATFSAAGTGIGLAEHALNAYNSGWRYVYGGASAGAVDCSGLIYMYAGGIRTANAQCYNAAVSGYISSGLPKIHGLGLWRDGHVGVYVGNGMAVDARGAAYGVKYQEVASKWTKWFKVSGVSYPTNGWEYYNGSYYYYQNGEYLTNTSVTVDGVTYTLGSSGACTTTPANTNGVASSSGSSSSGSSNKNNAASNVMKQGVSGDNVTKLQNRLIKLGFLNTSATGYFGEMTEAAVINFQKAAGLTADGVAGSATTKVLYSESAPKATVTESNSSTSTSTSENSTTENTETESTTVVEETTPSTYTNGTFHDNVYKIQKELATLGYFQEEATGYYGNITESAVVKFQLENGLTITGDVDELTYATLFSSTALENPYTEDEKMSVEAPAEDEKNSDAESTTETTVEETTVPATTASLSTVSATEATEIVLKSAQLASKALEGVDLQIEETSSSGSSNGSFIAWMVIMVVFMATAFWLVFSSEKKKKKARYERIKARANRKW